MEEEGNTEAENSAHNDVFPMVSVVPESSASDKRGNKNGDTNKGQMEESIRLASRSTSIQ